MKFARVLAVSGALISIGAVGLAATSTTITPSPAPAPAASPAALAPETFTVDPVHSAVIFRIKHNNVSNFYGRFNDLAGTWTLDDAAPEKSTMEFAIKAESVDSGNSKRDDHLRSPDFFNAKEFPTLTFKATKVAKKGDNTFEVIGDLTLLGKTKPVTVAVTHTGTAAGRRGTVSGIEATFTFKRSDFGMNYGTGQLGDEVTIIAGIEGAGK
jgi:polyisoprenoid-binding protein YceI